MKELNFQWLLKKFVFIASHKIKKFSHQNSVVENLSTLFFMCDSATPVTPATPATPYTCRGRRKNLTQLTLTCSKSTREILEKGVSYVQS